MVFVRDVMLTIASLQVGAWKSGTDIRPDEIVHAELNLSYDGKRDRYNGYDPAEHKRVIERYEKADQERRKVKAEERNKEFLAQQAAEALAVRLIVRPLISMRVVNTRARDVATLS